SCCTRRCAALPVSSKDFRLASRLATREPRYPSEPPACKAGASELFPTFPRPKLDTREPPGIMGMLPDTATVPYLPRPMRAGRSAFRLGGSGPGIFDKLRVTSLSGMGSAGLASLILVGRGVACGFAIHEL